MSSDPQLKGERIDAWRVMRGAGGGKPEVRVRPDAVDAVVALRRHPDRLAHGITDELVGAIEGHDLASYTDIVSDLNRLLDFMKATNTRVLNLEKQLSALTYKSGTTRKGCHGEILVLMELPEARGREVTMQFEVQNAGGKDAYVDIHITMGGGDMDVEVKFYGRSDLRFVTIYKQFIQRDLISIRNADQLIWVMLGKRKMDKATLISMLEREEARDALDRINPLVAASFLQLDVQEVRRGRISEFYIEYFKNQANFDKIFRSI